MGLDVFLVGVRAFEVAVCLWHAQVCWGENNYPSPGSLFLSVHIIHSHLFTTSIYYFCSHCYPFTSVHIRSLPVHIRSFLFTSAHFCSHPFILVHSPRFTSVRFVPGWAVLLPALKLKFLKSRLLEFQNRIGFLDTDDAMTQHSLRQ